MRRAGFVLNQQNRLQSLFSSRSHNSGFRPDCFSGGVHPRKIDLKGRPLAGFAPDLDGTAALLNDAVDRG